MYVGVVYMVIYHLMEKSPGNFLRKFQALYCMYFFYNLHKHKFRKLSWAVTPDNFLEPFFYTNVTNVVSKRILYTFYVAASAQTRPNADIFQPLPDLTKPGGYPIAGTDMYLSNGKLQHLCDEVSRCL